MSENSAQKLNTLADALYPIFLDRLKNEGHLAPQNAKHLTNKNSIFLPEIDYIVYATRLRGELRTARYTMGQGLTQNARVSDAPYYAVHAFGGSEAPGYEHTLKEAVLIPSAALKRDVSTQYQVHHNLDYRLHAGSKTFYIKGVMDGMNNDPVKANANCYGVDMRVPITPKVIYNTRQHWHNQSQYEKDMRIVTEDTMMQLLDKLESGDLVPNAIPWALEVLASGRSVKDDASFTPELLDWLTPYKIGL